MVLLPKRNKIAVTFTSKRNKIATVLLPKRNKIAVTFVPKRNKIAIRLNEFQTNLSAKTTKKGYTRTKWYCPYVTYF